MHACISVQTNAPRAMCHVYEPLGHPPQKASQLVEPPPFIKQKRGCLFLSLLEPKDTHSLSTPPPHGAKLGQKSWATLPSIQYLFSYVWMNSNHLSNSASPHWLPSPPRTNNNHSTWAYILQVAPISYTLSLAPSLWPPRLSHYHLRFPFNFPTTLCSSPLIFSPYPTP